MKGDGFNGDVVLDDESRAAFAGSSWNVCRRMIYVPRSAQKGFAVGFWPIPEAFWPDVNAPSLVMLRVFFCALLKLFVLALRLAFINIYILFVECFFLFSPHVQLTPLSNLRVQIKSQ